MLRGCAEAANELKLKRAEVRFILVENKNLKSQLISYQQSEIKITKENDKLEKDLKEIKEKLDDSNLEASQFKQEIAKLKDVEFQLRHLIELSNKIISELHQQLSIEQQENQKLKKQKTKNLVFGVFLGAVSIAIAWVAAANH